MSSHILEVWRSRHHDVGHSLRVGAGAGLLAGAVFSIMLVAAAAMNEQSPFLPLGMFASLVMGEGAIHSTSSLPMVVGTLVTITLSMIFGTVYGLLTGFLSLPTRSNWAFEAMTGLAFGAALWLINFQVFGRLLFPWLAAGPQLVLVVAHTLFYGVPLGLIHATAAESDEADGRHE
jgi:hypothetical protein